MSQPQTPTDAQALVQSMLQRLKLQPGRESQAFLHTPAAMTPVTSCRQDVEKGASAGQTVNPSPLNDSGKISNRLKDEMNGQEDDIDGNTSESAGLSRSALPGSFPTGASRPLADTAPSEKTNGERVSTGGSAVTNDVSGITCAALSEGQNAGLSQSFTPRVYAWSLKSKDTDAGAQDITPLPVGNGGLEALAPATTNSSFRKKQRPPEKGKSWAAKIRERLRDRRGSLGRKGPEDEGTASNEKQTETSAQNQRLTGEHPFVNSKKDDGAVLSPPDGNGPSGTSAHLEDGPADRHIRSTADFDFGLGSFSLLEEITKGQEWARFFNPHLFSASASQMPSEEMRVQFKDRPDPHSQSEAFSRVHSGKSPWSWGSVQPWRVLSGTEVSPDAFQPVRMEVSEGKQSHASVHVEMDQSEPMEDGRNLADMEPTERKPLLSPLEPLESSLVMRNRSQLTRKRHHQSAERLQPEKMSEGEEAHPAGASVSSSQEMEETEASRPESITSNSHPPPLAPAILPPRGVLKHSISRDSQSSMEILSKRRRVEENRRVHFSEEVVFIPAPEPSLDLTISEADSDEEEEEDCVSEQEVEHVAVEEVAPARRPALPQWILALKRKNTGKRPR